MKSKFFAENCYSFRVNKSVFALEVAGPDEKALAAIEQKLIDASRYYYQRQYQDAIEAYNQASSLILAQLSPGYPPSVILDPVKTVRDPKLFVPLLSVAAQWLNVLPEAQREPVPHPNPPVEVADLGDSVKYAHVGISGASAAIKTAPINREIVITGVAGGLRRLRRVAVPPIEATEDRTLGIIVGGAPRTLSWKAGTVAVTDQIREAYYDPRVKIVDVRQLHPAAMQPADRVIELPHDYYYVIPLGLAECYHALGDWAGAETLYFQAASYEFLNPVIEAPYLWLRLATLYADWGDALFRNDQAADAIPVYQNVIMLNDTVPAGKMYATASLTPGADVARNVIAHLSDPFSLNANPAFVGAIFAIRQQLIKIKGGLDFWGHTANTVPVWTFDYLQNVATNFAQFAINAEQAVINFWDRADQAGLTRIQIDASLDQAKAEVTAASLAVAEAEALKQVYIDGVALAQLRLDNSLAAKADYESKSANWIIYQALSQQEAGGDHGDPNLLNNLADIYMGGGTTSSTKVSWGAAFTLANARLNREYQINAMQRTITEMQSALTQANDELAAAAARVDAAKAGVTVAASKRDGAQAMLDYFDAQTFTPDVWHQLGDAMMRLYQRYLNMALQIARLMQQAYNFETDLSVKIIKTDYSTDTIQGLLGADALMADIQSFTYEMITTQVGKPQPIRQTISLAGRYGYAFETQLRKTGVMDFETRIEDFDEKYPGTYAGRIEAVEVEIDGIVPAAGVSGALTNCGVSIYRVPSASWSAGTGVKYRIQPKETLILSDHDIRNDALVLQNDQRRLKLFQGAGISSSWRFEIPRSINDIDYGALTDVKITFYYKARYDPDLRDRVLKQLATRPGSHERERGLPLRWVFPDAFFDFQSTGDLKFSLRKGDFPLSETGPKLTSLGLLFTGSGLPPLTVGLTTPEKAPVTVQTDATGIAQSGGAPGWAPLLGGTAIGDYEISLAAADNPGLVHEGTLSLKPIVNVALIMGYTFTPRT
jgi:tetratricopeptide (TPR) repeat protein